MEVKKKKPMIFWIVCFFGVIVLAFTGLYTCRRRYTYEEAFKLNWGIDLPENMERLFHGSDSEGLAGQGDGKRYTVFQLKVEPTDFIADFLKEKNEEFESSFIVPFEISENCIPDWEDKYYWKHSGKNMILNSEPIRYFDNLYMFYFPNSLRLIIYQDFI